MNWLRLPAAALTLAGRHGTLVAAASIFIGLSVPSLSKAFKPHLGEAIIVMLTLAFLRVIQRSRIDQAADCRSQPFVTLVVPPMLGAVSSIRHGPSRTRSLLHARAANFGAGPDVIAGTRRRVGLDVALTLASLIVSTAITPLTASLFTHVFLGTALASPVAFGLSCWRLSGALWRDVIRRMPATPSSRPSVNASTA
jgi:hypothetical protein